MRNLSRLLVALVVVMIVNSADAQGARGERHGNRNDYLVNADEAQEIMGGRFFGQREIEDIFRVRLTRQEVEKSWRVPYLKSTLERCRECLLFYYVPRFTLKGRKANVSSFSSAFSTRKMFSGRRNKWYRNQRFAQKVLRTGWYFIKTKVYVSPTLQRRSLGPREEIAPTLAYAYAMLLSPNSFVGRFYETADKGDKRGNQIVIGMTGGKGKIVIDSTWHPNTGVGVLIKRDNIQRRRR